MKRKNILIACSSLALVFGVASFAATHNPGLISKAADGSYSLLLDSSNGPALGENASNGQFVVRTGSGYPVLFGFSGMKEAAGKFGEIELGGTITNSTEITGIVSVTATFTGNIVLNYGLASTSVHNVDLVSGSEIDLPEGACYLEFSPYGENPIVIDSIKIEYDCVLSPEAEESKAIEIKRQQLLDELDSILEGEWGKGLRFEEASEFWNAEEAIRDQVIDPSATLAELEAISIDPLYSLKNNLKTNVNYFVEEAFSHNYPNRWELVNQHGLAYSHTSNSISTIGVGNEVGAIVSPAVYHCGVDVVMGWDCSATSAADFGLLICNNSTSGTGLDGYVVSANFAAGDHQYIQVFRMVNAYGSDAVIKFDYIGGWVYTKTVTEETFRIRFDGSNIVLFDESVYAVQGEGAPHVTIAANEESLETGYHLGFFNWPGQASDGVGVTRGIHLDAIYTSQPVRGTDVAPEMCEIEIAKYDSSLYESEEQDEAAAEIAAIRAAYASETYTQLVARADGFKTFLANLKTATQKENERHPDISVTMLDGIYSGDPTKYTASNWSVVNDHALAWSHAVGSHTVVTDGLAGYCMDAGTHTDFTVVFKVTGVHDGNPYGKSSSKGLILGGSPSGNYFNGVFVTLANNWGLQFYTFDGNPQTGFGCSTGKFLGGIDMNMEGAKLRLHYVDNAMRIYSIDANGVETQLKMTVGNFDAGTIRNGCDYMDNLNIPAGHFGIFDWGNASSTFEISEFKDL